MSASNPSAADSAEIEAIDQLARELYGDARPAVDGVMHVVSAIRPRADSPQLHVIQINGHAPKSSSDFFVLNFWRAHCDAILTTAQVVRAEPQLRHALQGPHAEGLAQYRRDVLGKSRPPLCAVLTKSGLLPIDHGMFADPLPYLVIAPGERAPELAARLGAKAEVMAERDSGIRSALALLRERGARTILIEAGPSTVGALYDEPSLVDHLMLSICTAPLPAAAVGGALPPAERLFAHLARCSDVARSEESGLWHFQRFARR
jgi:riboflavin biosynthesis pyrimidine reductase